MTSMLIITIDIIQTLFGRLHAEALSKERTKIKFYSYHRRLLEMNENVHKNLLHRCALKWDSTHISSNSIQHEREKDMNRTNHLKFHEHDSNSLFNAHDDIMMIIGKSLSRFLKIVSNEMKLKKDTKWFFISLRYVALVVLLNAPQKIMAFHWGEKRNQE